MPLLLCSKLIKKEHSEMGLVKWGTISHSQSIRKVNPPSALALQFRRFAK